MLKLQIDWQEHLLSHWKALEKIKIMFLTCLIVTVILSKAKDQEKGGRKTWGGGGAYQWEHYYLRGIRWFINCQTYRSSCYTWKWNTLSI